MKATSSIKLDSVSIAAQWGSNGLAKSSGIPEPDPIALLLSRATFGARQSEYQRAKAIGFSAWIEEQLDYQSLDDSALESALHAQFPTLSMTNREIVNLSIDTGKQYQAFEELRAATLARQLFSPRQLYEVMVEFWSNHFNITHNDGILRYFKTVDDRDVIRRHALGKFRDLLHASAKSVAMLEYLDNARNVASGPNENYARELLELHTLGVDGGYTETDVKEVARILTGWTFDLRGNGDITFVFRPERHDFDAKTVLGHSFPAGQGQAEGERLLDLLAAHPSTAKFIASKLVQRFVSDTPPRSLVDSLAQVFTETDGDIRAVLRALFNSGEFLASADQKLKRPAEFINGVLRVCEARFNENYVRRVLNVLKTLGQVMFMWPAPNGYPDVMGYWVSASALLTRWNFVFDLLEGRYPEIRVDLGALAGNAATPEAIVDTLANRLLRRPLAPEDRAVFVALAAGNTPSNRPLAVGLVRSKVRDVAAAMLISPYFQYR